MARKVARQMLRHGPPGAADLEALGSLNGAPARLIGAAASLFRKTGYEAATTRQLAAILGIRSASLYYHVRSKEDMLYAICVHSLARITQEVGAATAQERDPLTRVRTLITTHIAVALADTDKHATMLVELRSLSPRRRAKVTRLRDDYEAIVRKVVKEAQIAGVLRSDIGAKYLALGLLNLLNWSIFWYRKKGSLRPAGLAQILSTLFIEGAGGHGRLRRRA